MTAIEFDDIQHETNSAWLLSLDGEIEIWLPKSQCELIRNPSNGVTGVIQIPEWLIFEKELEEYQID